MKVILGALIAMCLLVTPLDVRAEEGGAGQPVVPAQESGATGAENMQGCMPGGGCCGACQAVQAEAKKAEGEAQPAQAVGGCPCGRKQEKTM